MKVCLSFLSDFIVMALVLQISTIEGKGKGREWTGQLQRRQLRRMFWYGLGWPLAEIPWLVWPGDETQCCDQAMLDEYRYLLSIGCGPPTRKQHGAHGGGSKGSYLGKGSPPGKGVNQILALELHRIKGGKAPMGCKGGKKGLDLNAEPDAVKGRRDGLLPQEGNRDRSRSPPRRPKAAGSALSARRCGGPMAASTWPGSWRETTWH